MHISSATLGDPASDGAAGRTSGCDRSFASRRSAGLLALTATALIASGCVSPAFRESVGQFGTLTKAAVADQSQRLSAVIAEDETRIRADLAANHRDLRLDPDCGDTVNSEVLGPAGQCRIITPDHHPIEQPPQIEHVVALNTALTNYSDNLIALAADSSQDQATFTTSVNRLATSLGKLQSELTQALQTGGPSQQPAPGAATAQQSLGAVAAVVAEVGNLYLAYRRNQVLRRIVIQADPIVQNAVGYLLHLEMAIREAERTTLYLRLTAADQHAIAVAHDSHATNEDVAAAQKGLFDSLAAYNNYDERLVRLRAIAEAHGRLAAAARAGASPAQMAAAIEAVLHLAGTIHTSVATLNSGSN
jgi:hypothetical protein